MAAISITIDNIDENLAWSLAARARRNDRSVEEEVRDIIEAKILADKLAVVEHIDAFRERLAASGRTFPDSTELIREERDR